MHRTRAASSKERVAQDRAEEDTFVYFIGNVSRRPLHGQGKQQSALRGSGVFGKEFPSQVRSNNDAKPLPILLDESIEFLLHQVDGTSFHGQSLGRQTVHSSDPHATTVGLFSTARAFCRVV
jgi:hypothetical protein